MSTELTVSIIINLIVLAFFCGVYVCTVKNQGKDISDLKKNISDKVEDIKQNFKEHLDRVEAKQDKHNNLIERMVRVEDSTKSAHHRIDSIEGGTCGNISKRN